MRLDIDELRAKSLDGVWLVPRGALTGYDIENLTHAKPGSVIEIQGNMAEMRFVYTGPEKKP